MYEITNYTKAKAKELGVTVKNSTNSKKKIDVYKNNNKVASVGAMGYNDYPTYIKQKGKQFADKKEDSIKLGIPKIEK